MTRRLSAVVLAFILPGCGGEEREPPLPQGRHVAATRALIPKVHLFGEPVIARVDVVVDRDQLDPVRVRLNARFAPYQQVGALAVERRDFDRHTRVRFEATLRCLSIRCLPRRPPALVAPGRAVPYRDQLVSRFEPAHVYYDEQGGEPRLLRRVWWPSLESISNLDYTDSRVIEENNPHRYTLAPLPEVTYRVEPRPLAVLILLAAAGLLAYPVRLGLRWREARLPEPVAPEPELSPLERARLLVREAGDEARRESLEALAWELDAAGREELADGGRRLAWSPAPPTADAAETFVRSTEDADGVR